VRICSSLDGKYLIQPIPRKPNSCLSN